MSGKGCTTPYLAAGILSGVAGMIAFLVVHHLWIMPIWFILPLGLVIAIAGGLAVGWAYYELSPGLPTQPWTLLAILGVIVAILLPSILLAELREPLFDINSQPAALSVSAGHAVAIFVGELLLTAILAGAVIGWLIGRNRRATASTALAGLIFALGPGHNIPLIGGTPGVPLEIAITGSVVLVSSFVLVGTHHLLSNWARVSVVETAK